MAARRKPRPGDLVVVKWLDITDDNTWLPDEHVKRDIAPCETVAWVHHWDKRQATLVGTYGVIDGVKRAAYCIAIPIGCITGWAILPQ